jgi:hypothetical protein
VHDLLLGPVIIVNGWHGLGSFRGGLLARTTAVVTSRGGRLRHDPENARPGLDPGGNRLSEKIEPDQMRRAAIVLVQSDHALSRPETF